MHMSICDYVSIALCAHRTFWDCWNIVTSFFPQNFSLSADLFFLSNVQVLLSSFVLSTDFWCQFTWVSWDVPWEGTPIFKWLCTTWSPEELYTCCQVTHKLSQWYSFATWSNIDHIQGQPKKFIIAILPHICILGSF